MKEMVPLRIVALCSNIAFIAYGIGLGLTPIWLLHASLLPLNGWRLGQALRSAARMGRTRTRKPRMRWRKSRGFIVAGRNARRRRVSIEMLPVLQARATQQGRSAPPERA
jgi:hypothetical protein